MVSSNFFPYTFVSAVGVIYQLVHMVCAYPPHCGVWIINFADAESCWISAVFTFALNEDFTVVFNHQLPQMYFVIRMDSAEPHMPPRVKHNVERPFRVSSFSIKILLTMVLCRTIKPSVTTVQPI